MKEGRKAGNEGKRGEKLRREGKSVKQRWKGVMKEGQRRRDEGRVLKEAQKASLPQPRQRMIFASGCHFSYIFFPCRPCIFSVFFPK